MPFESSPNRLALLRKQNGLSQKQLGALIGQSRAAISTYERGRVLPPLASAGMFQLLFGINIAEVFPSLFEQLEKKIALKRSAPRQPDERVHAQ
jgi:transcriptional regulator with XRE-family HTH domain